MIRTGDEYRARLRDGREVWIDGERVADVTAHPAFKPIVDAKARLYDMAHEPAHAVTMAFDEAGEPFSILLRPPTEQAHWHEKWRALDAYLNEYGRPIPADSGGIRNQNVLEKKCTDRDDAGERVQAAQKK